MAQIGPNTTADGASHPALVLLLRQYASPLVLILVFGSLVSIVLREWIDAAIILAVIVASTLLGFFQEYRASKAVLELRRQLALNVRALRAGVERRIPMTTIVPGDVVVLAAGDLVPPDGLVLEARDFLVTEASLTGESFPVEKRPGQVAASAPMLQRTNAVFMGSFVRSGTAHVLVVETGRRTVFGHIAARLETQPPDTEFERGIRRFGGMLLRVMILIVMFVLVVNQWLDRPFTDSLLFAVALAVGLSPELLPAIISVTLSTGARHMAGRGVLVRRLQAIENLGSIDVLCTDKTGTLTEGTIRFEDALDPEGRSSRRLRQLAYLNAAFETGIENPLDAAILEMGREQGLGLAGAVKVDEIPYDFLRRRLTIVVKPAPRDDTHQIISKGAFENVLATCTRIETGEEELPLDEAARERLRSQFRQRSEAGSRVLALATRRCAAKARYDQHDENDLAFAGLLVFRDPAKADAGSTIRDLAALGIATKIVSGDNRFVTAHLAGLVGLDPAAMLTGEDLDAMKDEALWHLAPRTDLFIEIDPQQKERIVRALQRTGHAVGYLGDGINDAPALHAADVGISVEGAVDVARETADVVLLERDLGVLRQGVEDGRRTFANTLKYIQITTSANFGNMVSMALATPLLPLLPKQILLNNFLSDLPSLAISTDNVDRETVMRPQRWSIREVQRFMVVFGLISSLMDLITFGVLIALLHAGEVEFQTTWFVVSLLTELVVVLVLRTRRRAWRSRPSRLLLWSTAVVSGLCLSLPFAGPLADLFGFATLPWSLVVFSLAILAAYIVVTEVAKACFYRSANLQPVSSHRRRHDGS
ncbi:Mg(2+) transport ATPase, P-type [Lutibaculum baratangense AMV1]|uniref:Magnesium-transporting ATPase, P-type 1 n=1 Tax=Lutibaculum baratangense AMV1 TaxID=631454 RepID=V4RL61_9HYPH|nr:Mg(2+) transport ATPase, P-type [Lutibaculum baratangense AMV1]